MKAWKIIIVILIAFNLFLSARWLLDGNLLFHTDIARDFWLIKDIWDNHHLTLIGARAGGLAGWFHGPLWLYLNLPAFILGKGNPVVIGWFWWALHLGTLAIIFAVAKKIFTANIALVSLLIYSTITILEVHSYINPQGALIIFPLFFYFYWQYKKSSTPSNLIISLFLIGLLIQFQIAFGAPILILTILDNIIATFRDKKLSRFLAYFILLIPLSTYIIFELRHHFIQIHSLTNFASFGTNLNFFAKLTTLPLWFWLGLVLNIATKNKTQKLFLYFYLGFWLISLFFPGTIMGYYYLPFLPMLIIIGVSLIYRLNKYLFIAIILVVLATNWHKAITDNLKYSPDVNYQDWSSWNSVKTAANWALDNCGQSAGYFVYTADLYGYNLRYALDFQAKTRNITILPDQKNTTTCLLLGPNVKEHPYGSDNWKSGDIKISKSPAKSIQYGNGLKVEKYELSLTDLTVAPNPNLIKDTFFR